MLSISKVIFNSCKQNTMILQLLVDKMINRYGSGESLISPSTRLKTWFGPSNWNVQEVKILL